MRPQRLGINLPMARKIEVPFSQFLLLLLLYCTSSEQMFEDKINIMGNCLICECFCVCFSEMLFKRSYVKPVQFSN